MRVVLELAGVRNCFGKQLGSANPLNNARATVEGLRALRTFKQVYILIPLRVELVVASRRCSNGLHQHRRHQIVCKCDGGLSDRRILSMCVPLPPCAFAHSTLSGCRCLRSAASPSRSSW